MTVIKKYQHGGFALLMTLLVISVIVPVAITILDVTSKQVRLAGNARDSEVAFHAANAGLECAQQVRRSLGASMEGTSAAAIGVSCFGVTANPTPDTSIPVVGSNGRVRHYAYQLTWGAPPLQRCTQIDTILIVSELDEVTTVNTSAIRAVIPSYPTTATTKTCDESSVCTIVSSRGYNRACPATLGGAFAAGTIQREVLLEY